jgi:hypothetical protein
MAATPARPRAVISAGTRLAPQALQLRGNGAQAGMSSRLPHGTRRRGHRLAG